MGPGKKQGKISIMMGPCKKNRERNLNGGVVLCAQDPVGGGAFPGDVEVNVLASFVLHLVCKRINILYNKTSGK